MPRRTPDIQIRNEVSARKVSLPWVRKQIRKMLKWLGAPSVSLSILLVDDRKMRKYNRLYLRHDRTTDVMAFPQESCPKPGCRHYLLGDILISLPMTQRQARIYGNCFDYELCFYLCHGILHLMGWTDKTAKGAADMHAKQTEILRQFGMAPGKKGKPI